MIESSADRRAPAIPSLEWIARPLDAVRAALLRVVGRPGRRFLADRSARVAAQAGVGIVVAFIAALLAPLWAFALGPIVLGVPHLLADVRYLVVRHGLHRRRALAVSVAVPLLVVTFVPHPAIGLAAGFGAILFSRAEPARRAALLASWAAVVLIATMHARTAQLVLVHGHNVLAVVLFLAAFARSRKVGIAVAIGSALLAAMLLGGALDGFIFRASAVNGGPRTGLDLGAIMDLLAPVSNPLLAVRLTILFVFAQGVHYVLWLRVVPEEARERPGTRSFASSLRALEGDLGKVVVAGFALFALVVLARATTSLDAARVLYLRAAGFHAYLEVAFALLLLLEGRKSIQPETPSPAAKAV